MCEICRCACSHSVTSSNVATHPPAAHHWLVHDADRTFGADDDPRHGAPGANLFDELGDVLGGVAFPLAGCLLPLQDLDRALSLAWRAIEAHHDCISLVIEHD